MSRSSFSNRLPVWRGATRSRRSRDRSVVFALVFAVTFLASAGCDVGVNDDLIATATAYPIRSPAASGSSTNTSDAGDVLEFITAGQAALDRGDWTAAERAFDRALIRDRTSVAAFSGRAESHLARGNLKSARADLDSLLTLDLRRAEDVRTRAALQYRFGDFVAAEEDYTDVIRRDPSDAAAMAGRGLSLIALAAGDRELYERALADFTRALALEPTSRIALLGPALVFADRAEFGGDPADWQRADDALAALDGTLPSNSLARAALAARISIATGELEEAFQRLSTAIDRGPIGPTLAQLLAVEAELYLARTDWQGALRSATAAIAADPFRWEARRALIAAEIGQGSMNAALSAANELLTLLPGDGRARYLKAIALVDLDRTSEAQQLLMEAGLALTASPVYQAKIALTLNDLERDVPPAGTEKTT